MGSFHGDDKLVGFPSRPGLPPSVGLGGAHEGPPSPSSGFSLLNHLPQPEQFAGGRRDGQERQGTAPCKGLGFCLSPNLQQ